MFSKVKNGELIADTSGSSVDWECDEESRSWSSSASWSDDLESEATLRLQQQLDTVERALHGEVPSSSLYPALRQEVTLWRATFPHLRLCGTQPPKCSQPPQEEEGLEEVLASHGSAVDLSTEQSDSEGEDATNQASLRERLKAEVIEKLVEKIKPELLSHIQSKLAREVIPVSASYHREPLLASRHQARTEGEPALSQPRSAVQEHIFQVSPLPQHIDPVLSRVSAASSRSYVTLPPIDAHQDIARNVALPMGTLGRQARPVQSRSKSRR